MWLVRWVDEISRKSYCELNRSSLRNVTVKDVIRNSKERYKYNSVGFDREESKCKNETGCKESSYFGKKLNRVQWKLFWTINCEDEAPMGRG